MKRAEIERRIALLRMARDAVGGRPLSSRELDAVLPDTGTSRCPGPSGAVIGVTIYRRFRSPRYRAYIITPDGKRLMSNPMRDWRAAVKKRNEWARQYFPGQPEFLCDMRAASELFGDADYE